MKRLLFFTLLFGLLASTCTAATMPDEATMSDEHKKRASLVVALKNKGVAEEELAEITDLDLLTSWLELINMADASAGAAKKRRKHKHKPRPAAGAPDSRGSGAGSGAGSSGSTESISPDGSSGILYLSPPEVMPGLSEHGRAFLEIAMRLIMQQKPKVEATKLIDLFNLCSEAEQDQTLNTTMRNSSSFGTIEQYLDAMSKTMAAEISPSNQTFRAIARKIAIESAANTFCRRLKNILESDSETAVAANTISSNAFKNHTPEKALRTALDNAFIEVYTTRSTSNTATAIRPLFNKLMRIYDSASPTTQTEFLSIIVVPGITIQQVLDSDIVPLITDNSMNSFAAYCEKKATIRAVIRRCTPLTIGTDIETTHDGGSGGSTTTMSPEDVKQFLLMTPDQLATDAQDMNIVPYYVERESVGHGDHTRMGSVIALLVLSQAHVNHEFIDDCCGNTEQRAYARTALIKNYSAGIIEVRIAMHMIFSIVSIARTLMEKYNVKTAAETETSNNFYKLIEAWIPESIKIIRAEKKKVTDPHELKRITRNVFVYFRAIYNHRSEAAPWDGIGDQAYTQHNLPQLTKLLIWTHASSYKAHIESPGKIIQLLADRFNIVEDTAINTVLSEIELQKNIVLYVKTKLGARRWNALIQELRCIETGLQESAADNPKSKLTQHCTKDGMLFEAIKNFGCSSHAAALFATDKAREEMAEMVLDYARSYARD